VNLGLNEKKRIVAKLRLENRKRTNSIIIPQYKTPNFFFFFALLINCTQVKKKLKKKA
jgi:hypothetical protein